MKRWILDMLNWRIKESTFFFMSDLGNIKENEFVFRNYKENKKKFGN